MKPFRKKKPFRSPPGSSPEKILRDTLVMAQRADLKKLASNPQSRAVLQDLRRKLGEEAATFRMMVDLTEQLDRLYADALASTVEA